MTLKFKNGDIPLGYKVHNNIEVAFAMFRNFPTIRAINFVCNGVPIRVTGKSNVSKVYARYLKQYDKNSISSTTSA